MSFITPPGFDDNNSIWKDPSNTPVFTGNPDEVDGTTGAVQVGGVGNTYTTEDTTGSDVNKVVLSGEENTLNVGTGNQEVQTIGAGNFVEAKQDINDSGDKIFSSGSFGAGGEDPPPPTVANNATTTGNTIGDTSTIEDMAGGLGASTGAGFYSVLTGGTGKDQLYGSAFDDFLRGGMGNDTIYAYGGNDVIRGGAGSDQMTLGSGNDTIYYTGDQLQTDTDVVTDFNAAGAGTDILAVDADRVGGAGNFTRFAGFGGSTLQITDNDGSVTTIQAQSGYVWKQADIFFVV